MFLSLLCCRLAFFSVWIQHNSRFALRLFISVFDHVYVNFSSCCHKSSYTAELHRDKLTFFCVFSLVKITIFLLSAVTNRLISSHTLSAGPSHGRRRSNLRRGPRVWKGGSSIIWTTLVDETAVTRGWLPTGPYQRCHHRARRKLPLTSTHPQSYVSSRRQPASLTKDARWCTCRSTHTTVCTGRKHGCHT